jgi:hypothetical protein
MIFKVQMGMQRWWNDGLQANHVPVPVYSPQILLGLTKIKPAPVCVEASN